MIDAAAAIYAVLQHAISFNYTYFAVFQFIYLRLSIPQNNESFTEKSTFVKSLKDACYQIPGSRR